MTDTPNPTADPTPQGDQAKPAQEQAQSTTFTQDDVDRIVRERVTRERGKYADYDDLKAKAKSFEELAEASKTEQERAVEAARREGETAAQQRANARLVAAETRALAAAARFRDPLDALAQLRDSLSDVTVNDDGSVDADAIQTALAELATAKPYLLVDDKAPGTPRPDPSQGAHATSADAQAAAEYERYFPSPARK